MCPRSLVVSSLVLLAFVALAAPLGAAEKNVLFLHTTKSNTAGAVVYDRTMQDALAGSKGDPINLINEYTDLWRQQGEDYQSALRDFLRKKYVNLKIDLLIVESPPALKFIIQFGEELFPGVPVIFCVAENRFIEGLSLRPNITGTTALLEFGKTLDIALKMQPDTRKVVVVGGTSDLDKIYLATARREFQPFEGKVEITYLTDLPIDELQRRVSILPASSVVIFTPLYRDGAGQSFIPAHAAGLVSKASNSPVFTIADTFMGPDVVGGYMWSHEADASETANLALRILAGEKPQDIPIRVGNTNRYIFDWKQMQKWGMSETLLPQGSIVLNKETTFWEAYRRYAIGVAALVVAETFLILLLLAQRRKRALAERTLEQRLRFEEMLSELAATFVKVSVSQIDGTITRALKKIGASMGADNAYIWELADTNETLSVAHEYSVAVRNEPPQKLPFEKLPWFSERLRAGETVRIYDVMADLPDGATPDLKTLRDLKLKSVLLVPLFVSDDRSFVIGVATTSTHCDWTSDLVTRLKLIGEVFAHALVRRRTEEALRVSEERFLKAFYASPDALSINRISDGTFVDVNECWQQLFGFSRDEVVGRSVLDFDMYANPSDRQTLRRALEDQGGTRDFEIALRIKSGDVRQTTVSSERIDIEGEPSAIVIIRDITERKLADTALRNALAEVEQLKNTLQQENVYLKEEIKLEHNFNEIVGESDALNYVLFKIEQVAPTDATVLILGETGTGKELVARAIHEASLRKDRPLVKINCATLPANLIESELFGHEKGAFTGAQARSIGRFELADNATLFLDEIGELPLELQPKLLRVLQESEFERLGSSRTIRVNVRIIAATNRDLTQEVKQGRFREDLWYRLNVFPVTVPPLRQRREDIPLLVNFFVNKFNRKLGKPITSVPSGTMKALQDHGWPGNIRELANVIERAVITTKGTDLRIADKIGRAETENGDHDRPKSLIDLERVHILKVLEETNWRIEGQNGAAHALAMNASTLRARMNKLGIQRPARP